MPSATAHCPVRIDLAGGTTDIWPIPLVLPDTPRTINVALDLPARAQVHHDPAGASTITLQSHDQEARARYADRDALAQALRDNACPVALLGLAALHVGPTAGSLVVETRAGSPKGAGLGGSSALLIALVGALDAVQSIQRDTAYHQQLAQDLETMLVKTPTGFQDYFPPLLGGCLALRRSLGGIDASTITLDLDALATRLRIVYTGEPHHSGLTNWGVMRALFDGAATTVDALAQIARNANETAARLRRGDLDGGLQGVLTDGALRTQLAPGVITDEIRALDGAVRGAGALGTKVLGAGGGGCVLVVLPANDDGSAVDAAIAAHPGASIPVRLVTEGIRVEHSS